MKKTLNMLKAASLAVILYSANTYATSCSAPVDLWFMNDESGSVDAGEMLGAKTFMKTVAGNLTFSSTDFQAGVIGWGAATTDVRVRVPLQNTVASFNSLVDSSADGHYSDRLGTSLNEAYNNDFYTDPNDRSSSQKLIVFMTDAIQFNGSTTEANLFISTADSIRANGDDVMFVLIDDAASEYANDTRSDGVDFAATFISAAGGDSSKIVTSSDYNTDLISTTVTNFVTSKSCAVSQAIAGTDSSTPTATFSPTNGATAVAVNSTVSITFNESIYKTDGSVISDSDLSTILNLNETNASGTAIGYSATIDSTKTVITITPSSSFSVSTVFVSVSAVEDMAGNTTSTLSSTFNTTIAPSNTDPTLKEDVKGGIMASINTTKVFATGSISIVNDRLDWLRRNKDSANKSVQGINVAFAAPLLNQFVNGDPRALEAFKLASATDVHTQYGQNPNQVMSDIQNVPIEIAMAEAQKSFGKVDLNPTGGKVIGDWFMWTAGQVTIGKSKNSSSSVTNESEVLNLAIGMDKPDADSMFGFALNGIKDMTDIGTDGSKQKSYGASISIYGGFDTENLPPIEHILGVGHMNISSTRIDGSQTLTGSRDARTVFGSVGVLAEAIEKGKATITPYSKLEAAYIDLGSYSESGGSLALAYDNQIVKQAMLKVGLDADYETEWMNGKLIPFTRLEYAYDFSPSSNADMHYVGDSTNYRLTTDKNAVSNWTMRLGGDYAHNSGASTSVFYERTGSINSGHSDSVQLQVSIPL